MATRRELDEAYREIQELKRELRALRPPRARHPAARAAKPAHARPEGEADMMNATERAMLASRAAAAVAITPASLAQGTRRRARQDRARPARAWPSCRTTISRSPPFRATRSGARTWCASTAASRWSTVRTRCRS